MKEIIVKVIICINAQRMTQTIREKVLQGGFFLIPGIEPVEPIYPNHFVWFGLVWFGLFV